MSAILAENSITEQYWVIDSRYRDFKFDLKSVIAHNTSSSRFGVQHLPMQGEQFRGFVGAEIQRWGQVPGRKDHTGVSPIMKSFFSRRS